MFSLWLVNWCYYQWWQVDGLGGKTMYSGVTDCIRKTYNNGGIGAFFPGLSTTLIRTFPVNAITFSVVTWILRYASADESVAESSVTYQNVEETVSHLGNTSGSSSLDFHPSVALKVEWNSFRLRIPDTDLRLQLDLETQPLSTPPWNDTRHLQPHFRFIYFSFLITNKNKTKQNKKNE